MTEPAPLECPVCHNFMTPSVGVNYGGDVVYQCHKKTIHVENVGLMEVVDAVYFVRTVQPLDVSLKVIEIYPYTFTIANKNDFTKTTVRVERKDEFTQFAPLLASKEVILEIPYLLDLPWDDRDKVLEKMKTYILFS